MYKILNKIFGWDYILWHDSATQGVSRVYLDGMGRVWCWVYPSIDVAKIITKPKEVIWLTCSPDKYFKKS